MKYCIALLAGLFLLHKGIAQDIYTCRNAVYSFFSTAPLEDIAATTDKGVAALNTRTGTVYFKVPVNTFQFRNKLMQEHFNENYLESDRYPVAEFRGRLADVPAPGKDSTCQVSVAGTLSLHGVDKTYQEKAVITVLGGLFSGYVKFNIKLADHHIKIPSIVSRNIAEVVEVTVQAAFTPAQ